MGDVGSFLSGVKVLDLSHYISGPIASQILADMGAEVVKIEPPTGDGMRDLGPRDADGDPVFYASLNAGKSLRQLDLKSPEGRLAMETLLADADATAAVLPHLLHAHGVTTVDQLASLPAAS
jgi:crotonobetainyl-CoA:carnitine CoA-transferase CaiB-like acyl-CoA transferase